MSTRAAAFTWCALVLAASGLAACASSLGGAESPVPAAQETAAQARTHLIRDGDTLSAIARRYGVSMAALADANGIANPAHIKVGETLRIPSAAAAVQAAVSRPAQAVSFAAPAAASSFVWPVRGAIVSRFGAAQGEKRNDGINIAVPAGTPVRAAADGEVSYVGNELRSFGKLVIVRHADGYHTVYGHNARALVRVGDAVRAGQAIAESGQTGRVSEPQLHFEIRRDGKPVDPQRYLRTRETRD